MSQLTKLQRILIWIISVVLTCTMILNIVKFSTPLDTISAKGYDIFTMLRYSLIENPIRSTTDFFTDMSQLWQVRQENEKLREQLELLSSYQAKLQEAYRQIEELKELNKLSTTINAYDLINAMVIYRGSDSFNNSISLNIGKANGVVVDDAVVSSKGLIGKVIDVSDNSCVVRLLTTETANNKVTVKIQLSAASTAEAILENYDSNKNAYVVRLLNTGSTVTKGMTVISSGLGGVFPSGLLVGTVSEVQELTNAVGMTIYVDPAADFSQFEYVSVVKRK